MLRDNRLDLVDAQLTIQEQSLVEPARAARADRAPGGALRASEPGPGAQPLPDELSADLERSANDIQTQETNLERRREERENIRLTFEADIKRYQELRAIKPR